MDHSSAPASDRAPAALRWTALALLAITGSAALIGGHHVFREHFQSGQLRALESTARQAQLTLQEAVQAPIETVLGLQAFMLATPELPDFTTFDRYAAQVVERTELVHAFAYVDPDRVIRHFYPLAGNERAIGLDLRTRPAAPFVEQAIALRTITVSHPTVTVQGSMSMIARAPLYRGDRLLGLVQGLVNLEKVMTGVSAELGSTVMLQLRDAEGRVFWGEQQVPGHALPLTIRVADREWHGSVWQEFALTPVETLLPYGFLLTGIALLVSLLFIVNRNFTSQQRLADLVTVRTDQLKIRNRQLEATESRWRSLMEQVGLVAVGLDREGRVEYVNPYFCRITGYRREDVIGKDWFESFVPADFAPDVENVFDGLEKDGQVVPSFENPVLTSNGEQRTINWFNARLVDEEGRFDGTLSIGEDVTAHLEHQQRLDHLAHHDMLTGLPNRVLFNDRLSHAMSRVQRGESFMALLMLDLDQFKHVNDSLGHATGDKLLQITAHRFGRILREADTVARLGGDEFTILLEDIRHVDAVEDVARKVLKSIAEPYEIDQHRLHISASIGIALYPFEEQELGDLLQAADTALYKAKETGRNCYRFYAADMADAARDRLDIANRLYGAVERGDFALVYQPIVDVVSQRPVAVEALLRWHDRERGVISPAEFIPVAESTGLIAEIGYWVLRTACREFLANPVPAPARLALSVNLSARQLQDPQFVERVRSILVEEGMPAERLIVEITETQLMENLVLAIDVMRELKDMGIRIAIDDFGTGYSSLSYLRMFPVDVLKIDRSFLQGLDRSTGNMALLRGICAMATGLGIEVIAEGVETFDQVAVLRGLNLQYAQGYFYFRPGALVDAVASTGARAAAR